MAGLARSIRLVIGLVMVAGGSSLAAPAGLQVAAWWQARSSAPVFPMPVTPAGFQAPVLPAAGSPASPPPAPVWSGAAQTQSAPPLRSDYQPPSPPTPLPSMPPVLSAAGPDLGSHYRTTLAVPPPPLIDGQRPPPVALGWAPRSGDAVVRPTVAPAASRYRIRDGDDLTAIAIRFYGTPAAAGAIWEANRGVLRNPGVLPIGADLVLPPADAVDPASAARRHSIEPPLAAPAAVPVTAPVGNAAWLDRG